MIQRIFDITEDQSKNDSPAFYYEKHGEGWRSISYREYRKLCESLAGSLVVNGIQVGDAVGSIMNNRPEWNVIDFGVSLAGAIHVSLFPTFTEDTLVYTLNNSEIKIIFISNRSLYRRIKELQPRLNFLRKVVLMEGNGEDRFQAFVSNSPDNKILKVLKNRQARVEPDDVCSILYTSGTGDHPKGVPITHRKFLIYAESLRNTYGKFCGEKVMSFLPLCHGFERSHSYYYQMEGKTIYYSTPARKLGSKFLETGVSFFTAVPAILQTIDSYSQINAIAISGAPLDVKVENELNDNYVKVFQSYGCTEALGICANTIESYKKGSVGKPLPQTELKIDENGVVHIKGPTVFDGYYKSNESVKDKLGFFKTGDVGQLDEEGFLTINGREGDIFKTSNGRFYNPIYTEEKLRAIEGVDFAVIVGAGKPYLTALLDVSAEHRESFEEIEQAVLELNAGLENFEKIRKLIKITDQWSPESGEFTHNMKLRRNFIVEQYTNKINKIYE